MSTLVDIHPAAVYFTKALTEDAVQELHTGAVVHHNSAAPRRCIAALDPAAALERDVGVAEGTNTTSGTRFAVRDCALLKYSPRALPDGEPTWVRKKTGARGSCRSFVDGRVDTARWS